MSLTRGEAVYLERRRRGITQAKYAEQNGLTLKQLQALEANRGSGVIPPRSGAWQLSEGERAMLMRRRLFMGVNEFADYIGRSKQLILMREQDRHDPRESIDALEDLLRQR